MDLITNEIREWSVEGTRSHECLQLTHLASKGQETAVTSINEVPLAVLKVGPKVGSLRIDKSQLERKSAKEEPRAFVQGACQMGDCPLISPPKITGNLVSNEPIMKLSRLVKARSSAPGGMYTEMK